MKVTVQNTDRFEVINNAGKRYIVTNFTSEMHPTVEIFTKHPRAYRPYLKSVPAGTLPHVQAVLGVAKFMRTRQSPLTRDDIGATMEVKQAGEPA